MIMDEAALNFCCCCDFDDHDISIIVDEVSLEYFVIFCDNIYWWLWMKPPLNFCCCCDFDDHDISMIVDEASLCYFDDDDNNNCWLSLDFTFSLNMTIMITLILTAMITTMSWSLWQHLWRWHILWGWWISEQNKGNPWQEKCMSKQNYEGKTS